MTEQDAGQRPEQAPEQGADRRKTTREPSYLGGRLTFSQQRLSADCIVRDRSDTGALLFVDGAARVPDSFDLAIAKTGETCRVRTRWRRETALGVEIVMRHAPPPARSEFPEERLRRLKAENERLKRRLQDLEG
jgi:hypothetical protein